MSNLGSDFPTTGIVKGRTVAINKDGTDQKLLLQVAITDDKDIQTVELMTQSGEDTNPPNEARVLITQVGESYLIGICTDDLIVPSMGPGEKKIYSVASGSIQAFINFLTTGVLELNGNTDFAVAFNNLKTEFEELQSAYNAHTHTVDGNPGTTGTTNTISTADIDNAKVDTVKLP